MKLSVHPSTSAELRETVKFYTARAGQMFGLAFLSEFERTLNLLSQNPELGAAYRKNARRFPLRRFPYSVVYQLKSDELRVIAIAHQHRQPNYWKNRG